MEHVRNWRWAVKCDEFLIVFEFFNANWTFTFMVESKLVSILLDWIQVSLSAFLCVMSFNIHFVYLLLASIDSSPHSITRTNPLLHASPSTKYGYHAYESCYDQKVKTNPVKEENEIRLCWRIGLFFCQFVVNVESMPEFGNDPVCDNPSKQISEDEYQIYNQTSIGSINSLESANTDAFSCDKEYGPSYEACSREVNQCVADF